jgi:hypothetical protein
MFFDRAPLYTMVRGVRKEFLSTCFHLRFGIDRPACRHLEKHDRGLRVKVGVGEWQQREEGMICHPTGHQREATVTGQRVPSGAELPFPHRFSRPTVVTASFPIRAALYRLASAKIIVAFSRKDSPPGCPRD